MKTAHILYIVLLVIATASFCFAQNYTMVDIGTPSGNGFFAPRAINATGEVTGSSGPGGDSNQSGVYVYNDDVFTDLGTLGGDSGIGNGINSSGQVAGYSTNASGTYRGFISNGNLLTDIGDLGGGSATAYAINDSGMVVGSAVTKNGSNHPFLYRNGHMTDLGTLGSPVGTDWWNSAEAVNNLGVVVGYSYTSNSNTPLLGFVWHNGKITALGSFGGGISQAFGINNLNQITGIAYLANGAAHAFVSNAAGKMKDLGTLAQFGYTWGFGINDSGVVVGNAQLNNGDVHAFVWRGRGIEDLNKLVPSGSGLTLIQSNAINNAGQILCTGLDSKGNSHAVVLTPQ